MGRFLFGLRCPVNALPAYEVFSRLFCQALPPHVAIIWHGHIGKNRLLLNGLHGIGIGLPRSARSNTKKTSFRIDRVEPSIFSPVHPGDIIAYTLHFPSRQGWREHRKVCLAASTR